MTDFQIVRGDDATLAVALTDAEGQPVDPDDVQWAAFTAKRAHRDADIDAILRKDLDAGITRGEDTLDVEIAASDTAELVAPLDLVWDVEVIDADGRTTTVASGLIRVVPDVTRSSGFTPGSGS